MKNKIWFQITNGWSLRRIFYLGMGLLLVVQTFLNGPWFGFIIGGYFASMGLFGFGCAGNNCVPTTLNKTSTNQEELSDKIKSEDISESISINQ